MMHRMAKTPLLQHTQHALRRALPHPHGLTRRQFLKGTGALSAGLTLGTLPLTARAASPTAEPKIVIVGAGLAGLACAYYLTQAGYTPTVYEARDRVGGRVHSISGEFDDDLVTEMGAEFINSDHEDMLALVEACGLELIDRKSSPYQRSAFVFDGQHVSVEELSALFEPYAEQIAADVEAVYDEDEDALARFDQMTVSAYLLALGMTRRDLIYRFLDAAFTTENGLSIDQQNALNFLYLAPALDDEGKLDAVGPSDERYKVRGGNQLIAERLTEKIAAAGGTVKLRHLFTVLRDPEPERDGSNPNYRYVLGFEEVDEAGAFMSAHTIYADVVVLAIPLTVLRYQELKIAELTDDHRRAIAALGYGTNGKLVIGVNRRVWNEQGYSGYLYTDAPFGSGWDSSELQGSGVGSYTFFNGGLEGVTFGRAVSGAANTYTAALDAAFPGIERARNEVTHARAWAIDPHALGSYSCPLPGQYSTYELLQAPVGAVYFAGEHTSIDYFGYMNGAAESGRRVAEAIAEALG
ncbi:MAG: FAD-dependent oxidoreductase [Anaerolineae bacterium]